MNKYSGYILCHNDVYTIEMAVRCLLEYADDVLVIDTGSTDGSLNVLDRLKRTCGIRYIRRSQEGGRFKNANGLYQLRNEAAAELDNDWVITLDADECFTEDFRPEQPESNIAIISRYHLICPTHYIYQCKTDNGRNINTWYPDYQARVFNRKHFAYRKVEVHSRPERLSDKADAMLCKPKALRGSILHYRYLSRGYFESRMQGMMVNEYVCYPLPFEQPKWFWFSSLIGAKADLAP